MFFFSFLFFSNKISEKFRVKLFGWLANDSDFHSNENVWHKMISKVSVKMPATMIQLQVSINRVWNHEINQEYIENWISSTFDCCKAATKGRGGPKLKYLFFACIKITRHILSLFMQLFLLVTVGAGKDYFFTSISNI